MRNLDLDFKVVYAGSEAALIEAFRKAEREREPLLGYFYSPQWLLSEIDLVHVRCRRTRPAATPTRRLSPATTSRTTWTRS